MRFVFVMDPLTRVTHDKDTSFAFIRAAQGRGHESFHCLPQDLHVREGRTSASVQRIEILKEPPYIVLRKDAGTNVVDLEGMGLTGAAGVVVAAFVAAFTVVGMNC